jgi:hypothetical protein
MTIKVSGRRPSTKVEGRVRGSYPPPSGGGK